MRKVFATLSVVAIALIAWWLWPSHINYANLPPNAKGPWIAFGDSLTAGYGAGPENDYPALLAKKLGVTIENAGRNGETSQEGLNRIESVASRNPRVVLVCFGGNDALQQVSRDQTFANLEKIIDRLHQQGGFVVLIGIRSATLRDKNAARFEQLAKHKRVLYVSNILEDVLSHPNLMSDEVHPNDKGYAVIADRLAQVLEPLMPQLR